MTHQPHPRVRPSLIGLALALIAVALIGAACAPGTPAPLAATSAPAPTSVPPVSRVAPATTTGNVPVGVTTDGHFYRGNLNASVQLVEFSEFQ